MLFDGKTQRNQGDIVVDKHKGILNVGVSISSKIILLLVALIIRRLLIQNIGNDVNGLNSLYTNIIGMLAVAELGIGSTIVYSMYSPIVAGEKEKVAALYSLYKKIYWIIGAVIFVAGLVIIPFLPSLINDYEELSINVYLTFFLTLISVVLSYLYSAKTSLIEAYKDNYISTGILTISRLIRYGLQIGAILIFKSYEIFVACLIIETLVIWLLTDIMVRKLHDDVIVINKNVDASTKQEITRNVSAMMMHKVGTVMVKTVDGLIISGFIGVVVLGKYTNYNLLAVNIASLISLFFSPLTSVVGHLCAAGDKNETHKWFDHFYGLNFILGLVFFLGYYAVIDYAVTLLFGPDLEMSRAIALIITINQFQQYMRYSIHLFRDASGTFYNDRWKPIAEGVLNLILSLLFVSIHPEDYKVVGVIVATIITTLLICNTVEPYVVFKHVFHASPKKFYIRNYAYTAVFTASLLLMNVLIRAYDNQIEGLLVNGFISVGVSAIVLTLVAVFDRNFRYEVRLMGSKGIGVLKRIRRR